MIGVNTRRKLGTERIGDGTRGEIHLSAPLERSAGGVW
jgi:hypothetical protein